jgi:hypothetical protein
VDVNRLSRGEQIAGIAAVLLLIDMFLNWYGANLNDQLSQAAKRFGVDTHVNAWQAFSTTDILIFVACVVTLVMVGVQVMGSQVPVSLPMIAAALGGLTTLIILWRIVNQPGDNDLVNVDYGAYIGLVLAAAMTYGAIQSGEGLEMPARAAPAAPAAAGAGAVGDPAPPPPAPDPAPPSPTPDPTPAPAPEPAPPSPPQPGDDPAGPTA